MSDLLEQPLRCASSEAWLATVLANFDEFLYDHASAEKKASGMAITMISHYPDRIELVEVMAELAIEELNHYREVIKLIHARGNHLRGDTKDAYVIAFRKKGLRNGTQDYFLDQLLLAGIIEARGAERFGLIAGGLESGDLKRFYQAIAESEQRHHRVFFDLAARYFDAEKLLQRLQEMVDIEAEICAQLPVRAALH